MTLFPHWIRCSLSFIFLVLVSWSSQAQTDAYLQKTKEAETYLNTGKYRKAARSYSAAFESFGWKGFLPDRLNAARAWAGAGNADSAFFNLQRIAEKLDYGDTEELETEKLFRPLHADARWPALQALVEKNSLSYNNQTHQGEKLLDSKRYPESAACFSRAFMASNGRGSNHDRLNAAFAWAMSAQPDSAYWQLFKIAEQGGMDHINKAGGYRDYWDALQSDKRFDLLRQDSSRWSDLLAKAGAKMPRMDELARALEDILELDQKWRSEFETITIRFGPDSPQMAELRQKQGRQDSLNQDIVREILDQHGWLGPKEVGWQGNEALFLVVQHASLTDQEKYLPMMREAANRGNAQKSSLALLEDRVLIRNGKKQLYGSQVRRDPATGEVRFSAIEDVDHVDERRATMGLGPLVDYARHFGIVWDAAAMEKNRNLGAGD